MVRRRAPSSCVEGSDVDRHVRGSLTGRRSGKHSFEGHRLPGVSEVMKGGADVERAKIFYAERAGFTVDNDVTVREGLRFIQLTPPGSGCSVSIGRASRRRSRAPSRGFNSWWMTSRLPVTISRREGSKSLTSRTSRGADSCSSAIPTATDGPSSRSPTTARDAPSPRTFNGYSAEFRLGRWTAAMNWTNGPTTRAQLVSSSPQWTAPE